MNAMVLTRVTGPECPECGCEASEVIQDKVWGQEIELRRCNDCGTQFQHGAKAWPDPNKAKADDDSGDGSGFAGAVIYHILRCPACQSPNVKTTSTRVPVRHHKCHDCGENFKSLEK